MSSAVAGSRGIALTVVIVTILLLATLAVSALTLAYNYRRVSQVTVATRARAFYAAQAGVVDARERIRKGSCPACQGICATCTQSCLPSCVYENPAYAPIPNPYKVDIDGNGSNDVAVTISTRDATTGLRTIQAIGCERPGSGSCT